MNKPTKWFTFLSHLFFSYMCFQCLIPIFRGVNMIVGGVAFDFIVVTILIGLLMVATA